MREREKQSIVRGTYFCLCTMHKCTTLQPGLCTRREKGRKRREGEREKPGSKKDKKHGCKFTRPEKKHHVFFA